jgi:hypothetical protein
MRRFTWVSTPDVRFGVDWKKYLNLLEVQSIIREAKGVLYFSPYTTDHDIWIPLWRMYRKLKKI